MKKIILKTLLCFIFCCIQYINAQVLYPGDGVRITFYNITDQISGDYYVQSNGNLMLPFIGIINTDRLGFENIKGQIIGKYDSLYRQPELSVRPLFKIIILGEVKTPGSYIFTDVERLSDLIAQAGGETSDADLDKIYIERKGSNLQVNGSQIIEQGNNENDIHLVSGDRIYVPRKWWVGARNIAAIASGTALIVTLVTLFIKK